VKTFKQTPLLNGEGYDIGRFFKGLNPNFKTGDLVRF